MICARFAAFVFVASAAAAQTRGQAAIDALLRGAVEGGEVPGVVAMLATDDRIIYHGAFGKRDVAAGVAMTEDTLFNIASMTKPVTSVATMQLVEKGVVKLDQPVADWIPAVADAKVLEFATGKPQLRAPKSKVTVRQLLTHTSGFVYDIWDADMRRYTQSEPRPAQQPEGSGPLSFDPGTRWGYGTSTDLLGRIVEKASGLLLEEYFRRHIFEPLGMQDTAYEVPASKHPRVVGLHRRLADRSLEETPRKPPRKPTSYAGGGGLYSTASDYVKLMQMILRRGAVGDRRVLARSSADMMMRNQIGSMTVAPMRTARPEISNDVDFHPGHHGKFGFGFLINPVAVDGGRAAGSLSWAGVFNTYFWVDPKRNVCGVMLTQILPFFDDRAVALLRDFERAVYAARFE